MSDAADTAVVPDSPGDERFPCAPEPAPPPKGRILLLDDDDSLRDVIRDYLAENGYSVVAVRNGAEGVREVLAADFTMILCDFMMPGLPGDMFYRAVEKTRPALCTGFIFMTGHRNDVGTNEFIKSVDGFVLQKPFPLRNLLDVIALAEVRRTFQSVFDGVPVEPVPADASAFAEASPADLPRRPGIVPPAETAPGLAAAASPIPRVVEKSPARHGTATAFPNPEPKLPVSGGSAAFPLTIATIVLIGLAAGLWNLYAAARDGAAAASAQRERHEVEWAALSPDLDKAQAVRSKANAEESRKAQVTADRQKPRWTPALRGILLAPGAGIELLEVQARGSEEESGSGGLRLRGMAGTLEPRGRADQFRQAVQDEVAKSASGREVTARFESLEDAPGAHPDEKQAAFVVTIKIGATKSPPANGEEGR